MFIFCLQNYSELVAILFDSNLATNWLSGSLDPNLGSLRNLTSM